jgi:glycosyltransferase involved in cell wall biosynthesis
MIVGGAQETVLLAAALADRDRYEPLVVCGPQTGSEGSLHDEVRRRGVELHVVPTLVRQVSPVADLRALGDLAEVFRDWRIDLVHTNSSKAGIVGRAAARRAGLPAVHTVHGWPFHDHQAAPVAAVWRALERRAARHTARLVVVAEADREKGLAAGVGRPEQYVTVRSGLELDQYAADAGARTAVRSELGIPAEAPVVGAVNRLSGQKDPLTLVETFAVVAKAQPAARLLVAGDGPLRGAVESRVAALGLQGRVLLLGLRDDVPRLLTAVDVFLSTSLWEGLPRTVLAAMATGVPVVATPVDGVVDVVSDGATGLLAPPRRPDLLGAAVMRVLAEPSLRTGIVGRAALRVRAFGADEMVHRLEDVYAGVLS